MRLAFCNSSRSWGGVKTWTIEFASALQALGHTVTIYGRPGPFIDRAKAQGLPAVPVTFGPDFNPVTVNFFRRAFRRDQTEAVLVNVGGDLRTAGVAARLLGLPLVQRIGLPGDMRRSLKVRLIHAWLRPHYLCPCRFIRDGMLEELPFIHPEETTAIHSAKTPAAAPSRRVGAPLRFVTTSQLNPNKGHRELLLAFAALRDAGHDFVWEVAGVGTSEAELRRLTSELDLDARVIWHGFTQNVAEVLERCDVFVLSSYIEGLPNTLLEAMAQGLVPVARNVGGTAEIWPDSLASFLIPDEPHDGAALQKTLDGILRADPQAILAWKEAAWTQCVQAFSLERQARVLEAFFQERIQVARR